MSPSMLELVQDAEGTDYGKQLYIYEFGQDPNKRRFYEGSGPYAQNAMGIGYMAVEGNFIVSPSLTGEALFAWLKVNQ